MLSNTFTILILIAILSFCWVLLAARRTRLQRMEELRREDEARCSKPLPVKRSTAFSEDDLVKPLGGDAPGRPEASTPAISDSLPEEVPGPEEAPPPEEKGYVWE